MTCNCEFFPQPSTSFEEYTNVQCNIEENSDERKEEEIQNQDRL